VIPHGIDTDLFCPNGPLPVQPVVLTMSAWPTYNTKGMHVLRRACEEIGIRAQCITGVPREQVPGQLRKGNMFVFPSTYQETWGLCLTEAMSTGLACIASSVAGPKAQITDGFNGRLVPPRDAHALASALRELVDNRDERERLGANARAWALENAGLRRMGRDYTRFYEELLSK
jgi:glycosyltransferase involved in cell wall biosynthesis